MQEPMLKRANSPQPEGFGLFSQGRVLSAEPGWRIKECTGRVLAVCQGLAQAQNSHRKYRTHAYDKFALAWSASIQTLLCSA